MKAYEVVITLRIEANSQEEAYQEVVEWMTEMTNAADNFPPNMVGGEVSVRTGKPA